MITVSPKCTALGALFKNLQMAQFTLQMRGITYLKPPPNFDHIEMPENTKLKTVPKVPIYPTNQRPPKMMKQLHLIRGPELIHNKLVHKQYGVAAVRGGRMKHVHFEVIRLALLKKLDYKRMFAVWRVDAPWQSCTKRPVGITAGGGKGHIHHYVTPVKAHRIIFEVGGKCEYEEVEYFLKVIANKMPFAARAVSQELLEKEELEAEKIKERNMNIYNYEYFVKNNLLGCRRWVKEIDYKHFGKYL